MSGYTSLDVLETNAHEKNGGNRGDFPDRAGGYGNKKGGCAVDDFALCFGLPHSNIG